GLDVDGAGDRANDRWAPKRHLSAAGAGRSAAQAANGARGADEPPLEEGRVPRRSWPSLPRRTFGRTLKTPAARAETALPAGARARGAGARAAKGAAAFR